MKEYSMLNDNTRRKEIMSLPVITFFLTIAMMATAPPKAASPTDM
jgi:hypothetical protein